MQVTLELNTSVMHIEFILPSGAGGLAAGYRSHRLRTQIKAWAAEHNIQVTHFNGQAYRLCFEFAKQSDYTLFALSWNKASSWDDYVLVTE